ncbi:hypothetical protein ABZ508_02540 [Streptomyces lavendulocolor]|uniref:Uncharacterized protein n=1 Tax=Streptomyces lavendulocolor TaxID=67316 RepID=A0ABV2VY79_9ACTN
MPLSTPRTWTVAEVVTAALMNQEIRDQFNALRNDTGYAHKTADEAVTSSTTLQNDNHLLVSLAANSQYEIVLRMAAQGSASGDIKLAWTLPAGATSQRFCRGPDTSSTGSSAATTVRSNGLTNGHTTAINYGVFSTSQQSFIEEILYVTTGATAGVAQLQWAQNAVDATATTVVAGSHIVFRRTA